MKTWTYFLESKRLEIFSKNLGGLWKILQGRPLSQFKQIHAKNIFPRNSNHFMNCMGFIFILQSMIHHTKMTLLITRINNVRKSSMHGVSKLMHLFFCGMTLSIQLPI